MPDLGFGLTSDANKRLQRRASFLGSMRFRKLLWLNADRARRFAKIEDLPAERCLSMSTAGCLALRHLASPSGTVARTGETGVSLRRWTARPSSPGGGAGVPCQNHPNNVGRNFKALKRLDFSPM